MKHILHRPLCSTLLICVALLSGCKAAPPSVVNEASQIEQVNYSAFYTALFAATYEGTDFYSATMHVRLILNAKGETKYAQEQPQCCAILTASSGCNPGIVEIQPLAPFRKQAEIYLKSDPKTLKSNAEVRVGGQTRRILDDKSCPRFSDPSTPFLTPYITEGEKITVSGRRSKPDLTFTIPVGETPYTLVRYHIGAVSAAPMRLDTVMINTDDETLDLFYRTTFPILPSVRKVEYRWLVAPDRTPAESAETDGKIRSVLAQCAPPVEPIEKCARPESAINSLILPKPK